MAGELESPSDAEFERPVPSAFAIQSRRAQRLVIVEVVGECDLARAEELRFALVTALDADGAGVIVDLTRVEFFDSASLGAVAFSWKKAQRLGRPLHLVISSSVVRRPFELTGLDRLLAISVSLGEAFASIRREAA